MATPVVKGRVAVRADIDIRRGVSGQFFDLARDTVVGQTFHLPSADQRRTPPKDPIRLIVRESTDGDYLASIGVMFQQQGKSALELRLWRWAGSVKRTASRPENLLAAVAGGAGQPSGPSRHWVGFPLGLELDAGNTYYFELSASGGWEGWRLRQSYGWYGHRYDPTRSAYLDEEMLRGADIPFTTYVWDVYDAEWVKR